MGEVLPWSASQVLATRTGALLRRYQEAFLSLETRPVDGDDMKVKMFVKVEKSDNDQFDKAPRAIQYRNTRYTAELARYLMPIDKIVFRRSPTSPFVKGLNSFERAKRMRALDRWSDTVYLSIDHSKFDAHVSAHWLRAEHQFYLTLCPDPALAKLLAAQLVNQARTQNGIVYTSDGGRMSGEFNTSLGNNLINYAIIMTICEPLGTILVDFDFVQDGDDFVIACRESSIAKLGSIPDRCLKLGMTTKVSNPVRHLEQVEFCQSQCLAVGDVGHRMVRKPFRAISRACVTVRKLAPSQLRPYIAAVASCEASCNDGVPILAAFASYLRRHSGDCTELADRELDYRRRLESHRACLEVTERARASFAVAFDVGPAEQLEWENYFNSSSHGLFIDRTKADLKNGNCFVQPPFFGAEQVPVG